MFLLKRGCEFIKIIKKIMPLVKGNFLNINSNYKAFGE